MKKRGYFIACLIVLILVLTTIVKADGFMINMDTSYFSLYTEDSQVAAINYENSIEKLWLAVKLKEASNNSLVWIVPIPANASKVKINIFEWFPNFVGREIILSAKEAENRIYELGYIISLTQIYTLFPAVMVFSPGTYGTRDLGIEVYAHIEKEGIVTEVITAKNGSALYNYLKSKNITIAEGSIPVINEYIGKEYSFVVSWIKSITQKVSYKNPAIFVEFPTEKIYYPLKPTSLYGEKEIPVAIYINGWAKTDFYSQIKDYSEIKYFRGEVNNVALTFNKLNYTKITIGRVGRSSYKPTPEAKNFVDDLWIEKLSEPPKEVKDAFKKIEKVNTFYKNQSLMIVMMILWLVINSTLAGALAGLIVFKNARKFALIGISNCLTLIGLIIFTLNYTKKEKSGEKFLFIFLFSIFFLVINFIVIATLLKLFLF